MGYKVGTIIKRKNRIINVNLSIDDPYQQVFENLTLKLSGKKVELQTVYPTASSWINQVSFGGIYYGVPQP